MKQLGFILLVLFCLSGCDNSVQQNVKGQEMVFVQQEDESVPIKESIVPAKGSPEEKLAEENKYKPFYIYLDKGSRDNHYVPSGFMPNGKCVEFIDSWMEGCHDGKTCMKIVYDVECSREDQKWAGVYWLNPPNNWGRRKGGYNLTGAERLTFWAKGEVGGEQIQEFTIGGISGNYPDSDMAVIGPVILSSEWKQYTIDLRGKDLSYISGGFAWTTSEEVNPESCVFYLDEMKFE